MMEEREPGKLRYGVSFGETTVAHPLHKDCDGSIIAEEPGAHTLTSRLSFKTMPFSSLTTLPHGWIFT